jgi:hypothetical protein
MNLTNTTLQTFHEKNKQKAKNNKLKFVIFCFFSGKIFVGFMLRCG